MKKKEKDTQEFNSLIQALDGLKLSISKDNTGFAYNKTGFGAPDGEGMSPCREFVAENRNGVKSQCRVYEKNNNDVFASIRKSISNADDGSIKGDDNYGLIVRMVLKKNQSYNATVNDKRTQLTYQGLKLFNSKQSIFIDDDNGQYITMNTSNKVIVDIDDKHNLEF